MHLAAMRETGPKKIPNLTKDRRLSRDPKTKPRTVEVGMEYDVKSFKNNAWKQSTKVTDDVRNARAPSDHLQDNKQLKTATKIQD